MTTQQAAECGQVVCMTGVRPPIVATPINLQVATRHQCLGEGTGLGDAEPGDPAYTLQAEHQHAVAIAFAQNQRDEVRDLNGLAGESAGQPGMKQQTYIGFNWQNAGNEGYGFTEGGVGPLDTSQTKAVFGGGMMVRRLTPVECLRLQGLPDDWLDVVPPLSDSAKYRMIGNGGAVPILEWIGRRILTLEATHET